MFGGPMDPKQRKLAKIAMVTGFGAIAAGELNAPDMYTLVLFAITFVLFLGAMGWIGKK